MEHMEIAKVTSKGQVTIPATIREILKLEPGSTVMFKVTKDGIYLSPCEVIEKPVYTLKEWKAIEKLVAEKGRSYKTVREAKDHIDNL
ncbi:MAG: AbrB/MazE/SpoVT family DNA-binding domain-containing protein [Acidobacteria bacterium]|nr:AbrB/MazE/SpoVT family DNA-binding domain-containing protein [Acidobacteriota bacterium]MBU4330178.1 AbrB/MazE/SpoVT family DNA-binding domain-containing protein [Acidobacteriota bacterium]MBU4493915.1 AbrB/MazE/SpoVT family DNA-binding domain-containing protein [Acidobacteriota bacterium]MCG2814621.1 AbrB/MazE/SpoVT family DNA-binding domain-containing protein [Candidatus Aminicenantes bacterium]